MIVFTRGRFSIKELEAKLEKLPEGCARFKSTNSHCIFANNKTKDNFYIAIETVAVTGTVWPYVTHTDQAYFLFEEQDNYGFWSKKGRSTLGENPVKVYIVECQTLFDLEFLSVQEILNMSETGHCPNPFKDKLSNL